jgi:menaquinone-specific isochorismate synthase
MSESRDKAWLVRPDGSAILGHGPFSSLEQPPADGTAFYVQRYGMDEAAPWKVPSAVERLGAAELAARLADCPPPRCEWREIDAGPFAGVFQEVMDSIRRGVFEKTVPVVVERGRLAHGSPVDLAAAMCRQGFPRMAYAWFQGERGFAGATPEILFTLEGSRLKTMALAGTARREERSVFEVDEKEIREHEYVAQSLVAKLGDLGRVTCGERTILDLGELVHFLTPIEVELADVYGPGEWIRRLHPTPALGPLPRTPGTLAQLIAWRERLGCPEEFGAPFGVWEDGRFDAVVAIRGVWWRGDQLRLPAGCGVIEASRLVNEWRELRLKREAVKQALGE